LLLEPYADAIRRGARIYSVISGYASTSEAYNIMAPEPEGNGMALTMEMAVNRSGIPKEKIGYVNAHGTSTPHNDRTETKAIKKVFGKDVYRIPVSSQKSMIGHSLGAAGAIEAGITALTLYHQVITPTINYEEADLECDLDYVPNHARRSNIEAAISNSFGFGGHNCTLVLERHDVITS
jgi:3-oxoacyl-[acyl-carrier-protein] synthase II